jgi:hypothetical protein
MGRFVDMLVTMQERVKADQTKGIGKRMKWPFCERQNQQFIEKIERYKSTFNLALNIDQR